MFKRQVSGRKLKCATKRRRAKPKRTARRQLDGAFNFKPGAREVVTPYRLEDVFAWLQDCPEQIERTVIVGNANCNLLER